VKAAALVLAAVAVFRCIPDGRYRTALLFGAIAGCTAAAGHKKQRREGGRNA